MQRQAVSFVVDNQPKFRLQSLNCIGSLLATNTVAATDIYAHLVNEHPDFYVKALTEIGVNVIFSTPFGSTASPYCNKLVQLKSKRLFDAAVVTLLDTDVVVTRNLSEIFAPSGLNAKPVDTASPPLPFFKALLRKANIRAEPVLALTEFGHGETIVGNCNGGVYVCDSAALKAIDPYWLQWAHWTLHQGNILQTYLKHADQISFLLALLDRNTQASPLELAYNFPTHLKPTTYRPRHDISPAILHYHDKLDANGLLTPMGLGRVDAVIAGVNALLRDFHREFLPDAILAAYRDTLR